MMNIDELPAGRELDAKIAELMGWADVAFCEKNEGWFGYLPDGPRATRFGISYYSICENSATVLIGRLTELGCKVVVTHWPQCNGDTAVRCCVTRKKVSVDAIAKTRPLAICRATLKARERRGE